jgi:hypothetical protein
MNIQTIQGRDVLKIRKTAFERNYDENSKMAGEKYRIFSFRGKAFAVNSNDPFIADFDKGNLSEVELEVNDEGQLSLVGYISKTAELAQAKFEKDLELVKEMKAEFVENPEELV